MSIWRVELDTLQCGPHDVGHTFFCNLTTLVHFLSSRPSYFFRVASSKLSPIPSSCRRAAALFGNFDDERYAMIDLWLRLYNQRSAWSTQNMGLSLQLFCLPCGKDLAHGEGPGYINLVTLPGPTRSRFWYTRPVISVRL